MFLISCSFLFVRLKRKGAGVGTKQSKRALKDPNKPNKPLSSLHLSLFVFCFSDLMFPISCSFLFVRLKCKGTGVGTKKSKRVTKDPNKPKKPLSAFFIFMSELRDTFKKENPNNKHVAVAGKAGEKEWKALSHAIEEKAPYVATAEKKKEYEKAIRAYNMLKEKLHLRKRDLTSPS
ncbi:unnamed protein product [Vicia faba]|uniref:HMG box domain-containing protein n=1 Tax=Vicia faba TaxID=3906 RepID=A0AAV0YL49_VICFA|nr:unnamed protein product [Vicia faba]